MKVNDTRNLHETVNRNQLVPGEVYIDTRNEFYLICTDEMSVVNICNGQIYCLEISYNDSSEFIPVNAVLEILS